MKTSQVTKLLVIAAVILAAVLLAAPVVRGSVLDLLTFQSGVNAAQAVDPTLNSPPNDGAHDFAVGGGQHGANGVPDCSNSVSNCVDEGFSAHSGPNGEDPQGHVSATFMTPQPYKLRGRVVCLNVQGNQAWILVLQQEAGTPGYPQGQHFLLHVIDNGNPVNGTPTDMIVNIAPGAFSPGPTTGPNRCGFSPFAVPLQKGNIVVHDEP